MEWVSFSIKGVLISGVLWTVFEAIDEALALRHLIIKIEPDINTTYGK